MAERTLRGREETILKDCLEVMQVQHNEFEISIGKERYHNGRTKREIGEASLIKSHAYHQQRKIAQMTRTETNHLSTPDT